MKLWTVNGMNTLSEVRKRFPGDPEMFVQLIEVLLDAGVVLI